MHTYSTELASGIVSTALHNVGGERFPTENLTLTSPVRVNFEHSDRIKVGRVSAMLFCHD